MRPGTIYVLRNAAFRDSLVKIGKTVRTSADRAKELSRVTGVPGPFEVLYHEEVVDVDLAEKLIHERLRDARLSPNREFFLLPLPNAVRAVLEICMRVNESAERNARRLLLWMVGQADSSKLKAVLARYSGGTTWVVVGYRNAHGEALIRLPETCRVRWHPRIIDEIRAEVASVGEIELATVEGADLRWMVQP